MPFPPPRAQIFCCVVDPRADGLMLASGGMDSKVMLWTAPTHTLLSVLEGHTSPILSVAFSPGTCERERCIYNL